MVNKINLLRKPLLRYQYFNNGIKNKKIALFDFDVTTCKTTNKCQKEGLFTTSVPVDPFLNDLKYRNKSIYLKHNFPQIFRDLHSEHFDQVKSYKIESLAIILDEIRDNNGIEKLEHCRRIVILECLVNSWGDIFSTKYPLSIQEQFRSNLERLLDLCKSEQGWRVYNDDVYWKDLAIARQQIYPGGVGIVESYSGIGLRQGVSGNFLQSIKFLKLLLCSGGRRGYYQIHTHTPLLGDFNKYGWHNCFLRIAEMLIKHKEIKGVFIASWFVDPQIKKISPRLTYLQNMPLKNGAMCFYVCEDKTGNAFAKSKNRLKLYNEGKYIPKTYILIWLRKDLIKWAKKYLITTLSQPKLANGLA